jgi:hypothetical protein
MRLGWDAGSAVISRPLGPVRAHALILSIPLEALLYFVPSEAQHSTQPPSAHHPRAAKSMARWGSSKMSRSRIPAGRIETNGPTRRCTSWRLLAPDVGASDEPTWRACDSLTPPDSTFTRLPSTAPIATDSGMQVRRGPTTSRGGRKFRNRLAPAGTRHFLPIFFLFFAHTCHAIHSGAPPQPRRECFFRGGAGGSRVPPMASCHVRVVKQSNRQGRLACPRLPSTDIPGG